MPSSVIRHIRYDAEHRWLDVEFVTGRRYRYFDVPPEVEMALRASASKGAFFNAAVRDAYRYDRIRAA